MTDEYMEGIDDISPFQKVKYDDYDLTQWLDNDDEDDEPEDDYSYPVE